MDKSPKKPFAKTTSAGHRFPLTSRPLSSEFHQSCIPAASQRAAAQGPRVPDKEDWQAGNDPVTQDEIWKESVKTEQRGINEW